MSRPSTSPPPESKPSGESFPPPPHPQGAVNASQSEPILQFFTYTHLPGHLAAISKPFCDLARLMVYGDPEVSGDWPLPRNPERTVALRKLLEAKDCAVRAVLYK